MKIRKGDNTEFYGVDVCVFSFCLMGTASERERERESPLPPKLGIL
jgi:hypothetical protein